PLTPLRPVAPWPRGGAVAPATLALTRASASPPPQTLIQHTVHVLERPPTLRRAVIQRPTPQQRVQLLDQLSGGPVATASNRVSEPVQHGLHFALRRTP